jgi:hypothetical protein
MEGFAIDFEWTVFADYSVEETPALPGGSFLTEGPARPKLVASGEPLTTRPLANFPELYLHLAKSEPTIEDHKVFATKYGLLTNREWEHTFDWADRVEGMRTLVALVKNKANWEIRNGKHISYEIPRSFALRFGPNGETGEITFSIVPGNLYVALMLQCISHRADGAQIRACKSCGSLFEIRGASGRRSHREFCSDKCRFDFNHRNRKGKQ